jgi:UDP-N-acetyl-D-mannosaminuronate dehydrogenase
MKEKIKGGEVCIVGLGYVGLPLANSFMTNGMWRARG